MIGPSVAGIAMSGQGPTYAALPVRQQLPHPARWPTLPQFGRWPGE